MQTQHDPALLVQRAAPTATIRRAVAAFVAANPAWDGADLADILDHLANADAFLAEWEAWWSEYADAFDGFPAEVVRASWLTERLRAGRRPTFVPVAKLARRAAARDSDRAELLTAALDRGWVTVQADKAHGTIAPDTDEAIRLLLPKLGPTAYLAWCLLADDLAAMDTDAVRVDLRDLAHRLGVAAVQPRSSRPSPLMSALSRLIRFESAWWHPDGTLMIRT